MHIMKTSFGGRNADYKKLRAEATREADHYENAVDLSRSPDNILIKDYPQPDELEAMARSLGVSRKIRDNAVIAVPVVCTVPQDENIDIGNPEAVRKWGEDVIDTVCETLEIRKEALIGAVIHMDETRPHIHLMVMPVDNEGHLTAKNLLNKQKFKTLHDDMAKGMAERGYKGTYVSEDHELRGKGKETLKALKERSEAEMERDKARAERDYAKDEAADYKDTAELWKEEAKNSQAEAQVWSQKSMEAKVEADMNVRHAQNSLAVRSSIEGGTRRMEKVQRMIDYITHNTNSMETAPKIDRFYKEIEERLMKWMDETPDKNNALTLGEGFRRMEADRDKRRRSIEDHVEAFEF